MARDSRNPGGKSPPPSSQTTLFPGDNGTLSGTVERVRFRAEETGYTVLLIQPEGDFPRVAAVGRLPAVREGEHFRFEGEWKEHPRFGKQFQVSAAYPVVPTTAEGIEKYLASRTVKHIGPVLAERIVARFGENALEVLDESPEKLLGVPGLGKKKLGEIVESWRSQREVKELMLFLQQFDIPLYLAEKIFRAYGTSAIQILRENPFRLALDIFGVGFRTADEIAKKIGIPPDAPGRCEAGANYILLQLAERDGHVFVPRPHLIEKSAEMLGVSPGLIERAIEARRKAGSLVVEETPASAPEAEGGAGPAGAVYMTALHAAEAEAARRLAAISRTSIDAARLEAALLGKGIPAAPLKERLCAFARTALAGGQATHDQANAIQAAMTEKVLIVTGGPGTGKTTIINAVVRLYDQLGLQVLLGAPTGRAAKRLSEVTQREAATIHRLLDFSWSTGGFTRNAAQPLLADVVIVDEASMLDISLLAHLLRAVPDPAVFILVGDVDQLPSVGPGNSLRDAIESGAFPVARLREVFRQEKESLIVENAHRVNRGEMPRSGEGPDLDYYFIEEPDPERCADRAVEICRERIPARFGLDPIADVQVIAPMRRGTLGVQNLNARLQEALNPGGGGPAFQRGGEFFRIGDKLMQTRNNYQKNIFNGDIGLISGVDPESQSIRVAYDGEIVEYAAAELDEVIHAYAVTVHKSQGSEYPAVVVPIHTQHYPMLQRNLIYTAMTRGKRLVVFLGTKKALAIALKNAKVRRRWSRLAERLRREMDLPLPAPDAGSDPAPPRGEASHDEAPPDAIYEEEAGGEAEGDFPGPGELTYHPVED